MTETLVSLWQSFGGISLKDVGVDPTIFLCSSEVTKAGKEVMRVAAGIVVNLDLIFTVKSNCSTAICFHGSTRSTSTRYETT